MSEDKNGWRPEVFKDPKTGKQLNDRCMITNGKDRKLVIVEGEDKELDSLLEKRVMIEIRDLVDKDEDEMFRRAIIFAALTQATVSHAHVLGSLVKREAKAAMNNYIGHASKIFKAIHKDAITTHGEEMGANITGLSGAAHNLYVKFSESIVNGTLNEFMAHVQNFGVNTEKPKSKKKPATKAKAKKK